MSEYLLIPFPTGHIENYNPNRKFAFKTLRLHERLIRISIKLFPPRSIFAFMDYLAPQ